MKGIYTHNAAILIRLLQSNGEWVPLPMLMIYTKEHCRSECYVVHTRINDLRTLHGFSMIENETREVNGVKESCYRINLSEPQKIALRAVWREQSWKGVPHFNQVRAKLKPVQASMHQMFAGTQV